MSKPKPCTCGQIHERDGRPTCTGHVTTDRAGYVPGKNRPKLDKPRPCMQFRPNDDPSPTWKCHAHGGASPNAKAGAAQRKAEAKARLALGAAGETVTDPIGKLCAIAGRAVALMEALGERVSLLGEDTPSDEARAEIAVYGRVIKDAAAVVESIIRMGIAERFAKQNAEAVAAYVACLDSIVTDLGHNPRDPEVAGVIARRLELVSNL